MRIVLKRAIWVFLFSWVFTITGCNDAPQLNRELYTPSSPIPDAFYLASPEELRANFLLPPSAVKPWVYWYWVNDHISKAGIEHDLKAMQEAGISTALIGIIHLKPSVGGYGDVQALSDEWWEHLQFAVEKAAEYNIDIGLFNSPGWSQSGGPWVDESQSMRYLDAREYSVTGGAQTTIDFETPEGFFQSVKVLAFKTPPDENVHLSHTQTTVTGSYTRDNETLYTQAPSSLLDNDMSTPYLFPEAFSNSAKQDVNEAVSESLYLDFAHEESIQVRTLEIYPHNTFSARATLLAKSSVGEYEAVTEFGIQRPRDMASIGPEHDAPIVVSFLPVTAQEYRLVLTDFKQDRRYQGVSAGIKELVLSSGYKLERYVEKKLAKVYPKPQPRYDSYLWHEPMPFDDATLAIPQADVLDLTHLANEETLQWNAPDGQWTVMHYFMRPTGTMNGPSSAAAKGPEIDKLSKQIAQQHFDAYVGKLLTLMPTEKRTALKYVVVDSYEQGAQNWTDDFASKFEAKYGYDPIPFLPVYSGRVVNSVTQSERFLWDVRRFVADSVSYEYTAGLRERAHDHGLKLWLENYGHWGFPGEFLQYGGQADILSGEFWASGNLGAIELKAASSAAHIYGHRTVMSESFTAGRSDGFQNHPWNFKKRGDWSFVEGINHTLLHVYIQQAYDDKLPGVNAWFGSEFNRNNTWFSHMDSWINYVMRANYMMQQGHYVADLMYFIGEDTPKMTGELSPSVPDGYSYDFINAEVILNGLSVNDGYFQLPSGMKFKLLVLPPSSSMRPEVLEKLQTLVADGGTIYGPAPTHSPSLQGFPYADERIRVSANALWQSIDGQRITKANYGLGHVFYQSESQQDLSAVLSEIGLPPDIAGLPDSVIWSHRSSDTHDIFFIANQTQTSVDISPQFRLADGMGAPQLWDAVTGEYFAAAQYEANLHSVTLPIQLDGFGSVFVVFEKGGDALSTHNSITHVAFNGEPLSPEIWTAPEVVDGQGIILNALNNGTYDISFAKGDGVSVEVSDIPAGIALNQPWELTFESNRDVPITMTVDSLSSLTEHHNLAIKHYSGRIDYSTEFTMPEEALREDLHWYLELGEVGVIARVILNGKVLDTLWSRPLRTDISKYLVAGDNRLTIEVATTWNNRLVGDAKYPDVFPDADGPKEFKSNITFETRINENTPLQPTGLMGPVVLRPLRTLSLLQDAVE